ncbi:MAG: 5-(carboxyamino)imidazole ribonucleotide mutase [Acidimicrobiia bacterium]|nr:5-(carboxyamino)imidazole ribonucleotide mutase [Acidimicrobiia bacterium]MBT8249545.1 5-(carboxyamino)imidazole ribonucleotide mutase [Acidimicrobiia bacterium]NNC42814.1 5-(carboxyamino)imidazole ribonucleotide mutase [Acidimicrobiia bacterium]NND12607.1 5-(carboxyamino)imidazole ribonucleotide mutase [Acidimicrobiia bacterium]NNL27718.1 5-(carboxyamino)imidazole ribonucleotide mutase [Acidimicrobiia bacterium]
MGSEKDEDKMAPASEVLDSFGIEHEVHVMSAHRTPDRVAAFATAARDDGFGVIICGAGKAAHLAGAVAAHSTVPVIGVPIEAGGLGGMDALLATVQMPTGIPVATVAINSSANAAYLAVSILSLASIDAAKRLDEYRESLR